MCNEYHVAKNGSDKNMGTKEFPFLTIQKAADVALAGDTVIVHEGEYRELVRPRNGGLHEKCRITYEAAKGERVVIKGSERIANWKLLEGTVWKVVLPNNFFGGENPYELVVMGDWMVDPMPPRVHRGDVYLNGKSFYEAASVEEVKNPQIRYISPYKTWRMREEGILEPEQTIYQWYAEVDEENTTIYANFHGADPNVELVEINVRSACFYPVIPNLNYITVRGFEMAHAASPWTPPTAVQPGLLGCHWSKGWIIENNNIHDAKCSGISIGKDAASGNNEHTKTHRKPGYHNQLESVFRAAKLGWSKETIGSHIIRNNIIHDCGQNGIVGHMGGAFSEIYNNEIYNIAVKHEFYGHEIGGIKLHAAIDTQICRNYIHDCSLGLWLDWQAQGTRVSSNIFDRNNRDVMIEVTSGPHLVDNNLFTSPFSFVNAAQGGAYVHNLWGGFMQHYPVVDRATPYHFPHSAEMLGAAVVYGFDDRWYQNIFMRQEDDLQPYQSYGTASYDGAPVTEEEYINRVYEIGEGDVDIYQKIPQPAYINRNVYYNDTPHFDRELSYLSYEKDANLKVIDNGSEVFIEIDMDEEVLAMLTEIITSDKLGEPRIVNARFENPDGRDIVLDKDMLGNQRRESPMAGPFENLVAGHNRIRIWSRDER